MNKIAIISLMTILSSVACHAGDEVCTSGFIQSIYRNIYALGSFEMLSYHANKSKTYFNSTGLSGGLVYNIIDRDNTTIPLKVKIGGTLGSPDWKYTFYDTSVALNQRLGKSNFAGVVGIGYRYEYSRVEAMSSHGFVYVFFGIKI